MGNFHEYSLVLFFLVPRGSKKGAQEYLEYETNETH